MTAPAGTAPGGAAGRHLPGLDGLRGVAVLGVLGYHSGWGWLRGGFLGVSLFLTLSGFLITRLLLIEHDRSGRLELRRFWSRRARRLLPAAFVGIALATAVTAAVGTASQRNDLLGDVVAAVLYVANWRFLLDGSSYAGLYEAPSTLQHLWSLAVEEQLYLVVPLVLGVVLRARRSLTLSVVTTLAAAAVGGGALLAIAGTDIEALYYGTHVRAAELLVGVVLALLVTVPERRAPTALRVIGGPVALAGVLWAWTAWRFADDQLYRGGLLAHALLVAAVLWAVTTGPSPLTALLGLRPIEWIGRRSYGIYLYHWPLFLFAEQSDVDLPRGVLLAGAWAASLALAAISYVVLEQPVRLVRAFTSRRAVGAGLVGVPAAVVLVAAFAISPRQVHDPEATVARLDALAAGSARVAPPAVQDGDRDVVRLAPPAAPSDTIAPRPAGPPLRLAIFGDSIAASNGLGLAEWAVEHPRFDLVSGITIPGCTLVPVGTRWDGEDPIQVEPGCDWRRGWPSNVAEHRPDVVVVASGALDALPWSLPDHPGRLHVEDEPVGQRIQAEIDGINAFMTGAGVHVLWLTLPAPDYDNGSAPALARINRMIERSAAATPGVSVFDMAEVVDDWTEEGLYRSDGVHLDADDSRRLAREHLGPALLEVAGLQAEP